MCYDVFWCTNNVWLILVLVAVKGWKISISGSNHFYFICSFLWDHWYCWYCFTPQVVQQTFHFLGQAVSCRMPPTRMHQLRELDPGHKGWKQEQWPFLVRCISFSNSKKTQSLHPPPDSYVFLRLKIRELSRNPGILWWLVTRSTSEIVYIKR